MFHKQECVAMLLAGGQGSRLYALTDKTAKPAVGFGGKYRIIDFPLSNLVNSGIYTVGVLTQYQPLVLNEYIGNGAPWDLDRLFGGVTVLPPYQGKHTSDWYKGTANAIYQNFAFIDRYDPDYVLVLSGDHIYKMDYAAMLAAHKKSGSDATIAVISVPIDEASRFGIMNTYENNRIYEFEEKPKNPKSDKASMGIYIFNRKILKKYLLEDELKKDSSNDFGKNIIPSMLSDGKKLYAYPFAGYWKDVGTVNSLWEANMDLLGKKPDFNLHDSHWRIFSRSYSYSPQYIAPGAVVANSIITEGCEIKGSVINSVLGAGVKVESGAVVRDSIIMNDAEICAGASVSYSIIDSEARIGARAKIGGEKLGDGISVIGATLAIPADMIVSAGAMFGEDSSYMSIMKNHKE